MLLILYTSHKEKIMANTTTPTLSSAIQGKSFADLKTVVDSATKIYASELGAEPKVRTPNGVMPITAVFDVDGKWELVAAAYAGIVNAVENLPEGVDKSVEIAKLISTNQVLRYITAEPTTGNGLL